MSALNAANTVCDSTAQVGDDFSRDVLNGLRAASKSIPCKHLYDKRGSELFDQICDLEEYYVTRCELEIMERAAKEMAAALGEGVQLVELGSGSSVKTRLLLEHMKSPAAYVPVDVSQEHLAESCQRLEKEHPGLDVQPLYADFTQEFELPASDESTERTVFYFPGSTVGNLQHHEAQKLLAKLRGLCGGGGGLLIGIDLRKDPQVVHAAYNDSQGVTAEFNRNLLRRINRELDADFDLGAFEYQAVYDEHRGRVESSLVSKTKQSVTIGCEAFSFAEHEELRTEYSHKYTIPQFERLALEAGFKLAESWTDEREYVAVLLMHAVE